MVDFTKSEGLLQTNEWETLDDTGGTPYYESNELNNADDIGAMLHIDVCHKDANAASSGPIIIIWIKSGAADEHWHELIRFEGTSGTAGAQTLDQASSSGQKNVYVPLTDDFDEEGLVCFLKDAGVLANSQLVVVGKVVTDDYVVTIENLVRSFDTSDILYNMVDQWPVRIPKEVKAARVTMHNPDGDATYAVRVRFSKDTDIE